MEMIDEHAKVEDAVDKLEMSDSPKLNVEGNSSLFSLHPNLEEIRAIQAKFAADRNWNQYHQPRNLLLALVGEVGELAELFQWRGEVKEGLPDWTKEEKDHLEQELSDVLLYLVRLSEKCRIDLPAAVLKKIDINSEKYPVPQVYGSNKKYTEYNTEKVYQDLRTQWKSD